MLTKTLAYNYQVFWYTQAYYYIRQPTTSLEIPSLLSASALPYDYLVYWGETHYQPVAITLAFNIQNLTAAAL